jgi:hypothetical protein
VRDVYRSSQGDPEKIRSGLQGLGLYEQLNKFDTNLAATQKAKTEAQAADFKLKADIFEKKGQIFGAVMRLPDNQIKQGAVQALQVMTQNGWLTPEQAEQSLMELESMDPAQVREKAQFGMTSVLSAKDQLLKGQTTDLGGQVSYETFDPVTGKVTRTGVGNKTLTPEAILTDERARSEGEKNRGVTIRGQNMTDARAREQNDYNRTQGRAPAGYRFNSQGNLEAIPGGPADKAKNPTEAQGKAALFSSRAAESDKIISDLEGKYSPLAINAKTGAGRVPVVGGMAEITANKMLPENEQKAEQAQRDFINAILRQESGAVISDSEFDNARKQYFPQPGDSKGVIAQKKRNRQTAINGLRNMAGPALNSGASGDWSIEEVK